MESTAQLRKRVLLVLIAMFLGALVLSIGAAWYTCDWGGLALNAGTEMGGAAVTYYLFDRVIRRMEELEKEREVEKKEKAKLIARMGSSRADVAVAAAEELGRHGWLYDGSLQGANLVRANLRGAKLVGANLRGAKLMATDLQRALLVGANLQGVDLGIANLQEAALAGANLQEANLFGVRLQKANLLQADLQGADLADADLQGAILVKANLQGANLAEDTTLPDGMKWTLDTDIARFTDRDHPDFWRSGT